MKTSNNIQSIIMAGGSGTRLWPISKHSMPKQFIKFFAGKSLLQMTLERNKEFAPSAVIVQEKHRFIVKKQIEEIGIKADIIIEPIGKSTAPCAIVASLYAKEKNADTVLLLPADHFIRKKNKYVSTIREAVRLSTEDNIVTFGVKPYKAHAGYGYLKTGSELSPKLFAIEEFIEKPNISKAAEYIKEGIYYWNSGIFAFRPQSMLNLAVRINPEMHSAVKKSFNGIKKDSGFLILDPVHYKEVISDSIDYAFMENKLANIAMLKADFVWNDLGSWNSMHEIHNKDKNGNVAYGNSVMHDTANSYIHSENKLTIIVGANDLIVVNTEDISFIVHKSKIDHINRLLKYLQNKIK